MVQRFGSVIQLKAEAVEAYERLHADPWVGVTRRLSASHFGNYSIFRYGSTLFSYVEYSGRDLEADSARVAADEENQRWIALIEPMQLPVPEARRAEWWHPLPEIFHLP